MSLRIIRRAYQGMDDRDPLPKLSLTHDKRKKDEVDAFFLSALCWGPAPLP